MITGPAFSDHALERGVSCRICSLKAARLRTEVLSKKQFFTYFRTGVAQGKGNIQSNNLGVKPLILLIFRAEKAVCRSFGQGIACLVGNTGLKTRTETGDAPVALYAPLVLCPIRILSLAAYVLSVPSATI